MKNYILYIWYIAIKDIRAELQRKDLLVLTTIFSFTCVVIFNISIDVANDSYIRVLPGILWVTIFFTAVLGLNRFLSTERDSGNFESLLLLPISRDILFLGKVTTLFLFMIVLEILIFPIFTIIFNLNIILLAQAFSLVYSNSKEISSKFDEIDQSSLDRDCLLYTSPSPRDRG